MKEISDPIPDLKVKKIGEALWLIPQKEIDVNSVNMISKNIQDHIGKYEPLPIVFDLSKIEYIDSSTIGLIAGLIKLYKEKKLELFFLKPTEFVRSVFTQTGLSQIANICDSIKDLPTKYQKTERKK
jgi:anti-anti-sigma factor